jgi:hypothetical protein
VPDPAGHDGSLPAHAWPGKLLVALMALGGFGALFASLWSLLGTPPGTVRMFGLRATGWVLSALLPRLAMVVFGLGLLSSAWGVVTWRRWSWWAALGLTVLFGLGFLAQLAAPLWGGAGASVLDFYALLYVVCLPYLFRNRRFFRR